MPRVSSDSARNDVKWEAPADKFIFLNEILIDLVHNVRNQHHEENHGRRYSTYVQRLRAGVHLHRCRSGVLPGTRLFDPQALQNLPHGKKERPRRRRRISLRIFAGYTRHLFGLRTAHHRSFRATRRQACLLQGLLSGTQGFGRRFTRAGTLLAGLNVLQKECESSF